MSNHTPGPWGIEDCNETCMLLGIEERSDWIAIKSGASTLASTYMHSHEQNLANARVIVLAPDMLAYCRLMAANGDPDAIELVAKAEGRS